MIYLRYLFLAAASISLTIVGVFAYEGQSKTSITNRDPNDRSSKRNDNLTDISAIKYAKNLS